MQQYFVQSPLVIGEKYLFTRDQAHHAKHVVRLHDETVRLVYEGAGYFARCTSDGDSFGAIVLEKDPHNRELKTSVTLAMALIRREKFEFVLQKAAELGVKKIIPFESSRCVVHAKKERADHQKQRWTSILQEAAEQCKRNRIPEITDIQKLSDLKKDPSFLKILAYENAERKSAYLSDAFHGQESVLIVIGPEGGFAKEEVEELSAADFSCVTLGNRILRAETAALYACSVIAELDRGQ